MEFELQEVPGSGWSRWPEMQRPQSIVDDRSMRFWSLSTRKRQAALITDNREHYYAGLVGSFALRADEVAKKDRKQIQKDLPRTFSALPPIAGPADETALLPLLENILAAYVERGRTMSATADGAIGMQVCALAGAATSARVLLTGYPQGLNFLAAMSLLCVGGRAWDGSRDAQAALEEAAFWLLATLLEDVLDPDFFGADVREHLQMAYIGGLGLRSLIVDLAEDRCPKLCNALGPEAFRSSLMAVLDNWVLSLFVGCVPARLLDELWDRLLVDPTASQVQSWPHRTRGRVPWGLGTIVSFALAALQICGEDELAGSEALLSLQRNRLDGASPEQLSLEATEAVQRIRRGLLMWPESQDNQLLARVDGIAEELSQNNGASGLWDEVRRWKQMIAEGSEDFDQQLMSLAKRTHFTVQEIARLREALEKMQGDDPRRDNARVGKSRSAGSVSGSSCTGGDLSLETFNEVVGRVIPEFPPELCGRLFQKLDAFGVGRLAFAELACGMSTLALGAMDEKLQVCFDLFDSEGQRALTLKDVGDLCAVLFRVAHKQGRPDAQCAATDEVLWTPSLQQRLVSRGTSATTFSPDGAQHLDRHGETPRFDREGRHSSPASPSLGPFRPRPKDVSPPPPWRSMLLRLLASAQVRTPGGPVLVSFEDFRNAAHMEPALLCLFSWCLPRTPHASEVNLSPCGPQARGSFIANACATLRACLARHFACRRDRALQRDTARTLL